MLIKTFSKGRFLREGKFQRVLDYNLFPGRETQQQIEIRFQWKQSFLEDLDFIVDIHIKGTFFSLKHQVRHFLAAGQPGAIVNMSSVYGVGADLTAFPSYVAAKHAIVGLTRSAAIQYASAGIRVNAVLPGVIETPLIANSLSTDPDRLLRMHPVGRLGKPEEVAKTVAWLCSDDAGFITGSCIPIDGGNGARC